jgi:hypothetical protein
MHGTDASSNAKTKTSCRTKELKIRFYPNLEKNPGVSKFCTRKIRNARRFFEDTSQSFSTLGPALQLVVAVLGGVSHLQSVMLEKKIQTLKVSEFARQTRGKRDKQLLLFSWSSFVRSV